MSITGGIGQDCGGSLPHNEWVLAKRRFISGRRNTAARAIEAAPIAATAIRKCQAHANRGQPETGQGNAAGSIVRMAD